FRSACQAAISRFGGVELPATGTTFLACFGYPIAREDAARSAVRAGLALVSESGSAIRAAVHAGPAVVTEVAGRPGIVGEVVNFGRLDAFCPPGHVVLTAAARRLVGGYFDCELVGEVALRPGSQVELYRVVGESAAHNRVEAADPARLTPLVGRDREV